MKNDFAVHDFAIAPPSLRIKATNQLLLGLSTARAAILIRRFFPSVYPPLAEKR